MDGQRILLGGLMNKQGFFWLNADEGEDTFLDIWMKTDGKTKKCGICAPKSYSLPWTRQFLFYFYYSRVEMKNTNISAYFVHLLPQPWLIH